MKDVKHELLRRASEGPSTWRHYEGGNYVVLGMAVPPSRLSSALSWVVVYHPVGRPGELYYQPPQYFCERVERRDDGTDIYRFEPVGAAHD